MLESLEQNNIKRMTVEQQEQKPFYFDWEKELTPETWKKIEEWPETQAQGISQVMSTSDYVNLHYYAKMLGRDLPWTSTANELFETLKEQIRKERASFDNLEAFANLIKLFPEEQRNFSEIIHEALTEVLRAEKGDTIDHQSMLKDLVDREIPDAEKIPALTFTDEDLRKAIEVAANEDTYMNDRLVIADSIRRRNPNFDINELNITQEEIAAELKSNRDNNYWSAFVEDLYYLKELSVKGKSEFDEDKTKPMPEQRSF